MLLLSLLTLLALSGQACQPNDVSGTLFYIDGQPVTCQQLNAPGHTCESTIESIDGRLEPDSTYTESTTLGELCSATLSCCYDAEAVDYIKLSSSSAGCVKADGSEGLYFETENASLEDCKNYCRSQPLCFGISHNSNEICRLHQQDADLVPSSDSGDFDCFVEYYPQTPGYIDLGLQKCQTAAETDPKYAYYHEIGFDACKQHCDQNEDCFGFSVSAYNNCLNWLESDLIGGGANWGGAKCYLKAGKLGITTEIVEKKYCWEGRLGLYNSNQLTTYESEKDCWAACEGECKGCMWNYLYEKFTTFEQCTEKVSGQDSLIKYKSSLQTRELEKKYCTERSSTINTYTRHESENECWAACANEPECRGCTWNYISTKWATFDECTRKNSGQDSFIVYKYDNFDVRKSSPGLAARVAEANVADQA